PRVGRFFAVDPLAKEYPWYTPYQFSGNKVIALNELEGLEEGKLDIDENAKTAILTWKKVYYVVSDGRGKVMSPNLIDTSEINSILNEGDNLIYVKKLPGSKKANGKYEKIKLSS